MHTGYDNFWMHKNSRPKPVLNLPKNDNFRCALLTDNYKHMQNGGCPGQLSSFIPPQNNAASSHEKDHYRNSHDQSMWPSSVYSLPFMSSYANNLHPQETFFTHTNNFVYSSPNPQAQEKHDFRHLGMSDGNVNILTMQNTNTSTLTNNGLAHAQNNKNTNTQIPRIRVKDVFSLNNKSVQSQLGLDGHFGIRQQKELRCATHCNRALESQTQTEYIKHKNANLVESSKSTPHFEHRTAKQTYLNNQEQFQNSCSFYQQNDDFSLGNFEFRGGRQKESSLSLESFKSSTPTSLLSQLLAQDSILERELQNHRGNMGEHGNAQRGHGGEKATPMGNLVQLQNANYSDSSYSRSCGLNERAPDKGTNLRNVTNFPCDLQENLPKTNEVNLMSRNSASNIMDKNALSVTSKSPPLKEINNQQNCFIKISIPCTGKTSFIRLNDRDDIERNSAVSLQSFFEQNAKNCSIDRNTRNIHDEENVVVNSLPPVGQGSSISHQASPKTSSICDSSANEGGTIIHKNSFPALSTTLITSPRNHQQGAINQRLHLQFDALSNTNGDFYQNSVGAPEIIQQKFAVEISRGDDDTAVQQIPTSDCTITPLALKQESFHPEIENASLQRTQNPPTGKEFHRSIKTEESSENLSVCECELRLQPLDVVNQAVSKFHVEGCRSASKSRSESAPVTDSKDHVDQVNTLKSSSNKIGGAQKSEEKKKGREVSLSRVNYKSNINRDKLDLLIQFLKKGQDTGGSISCKERQSCRESASSAKSDSYRSRRKLNKSSIVRNKNNSREMISLMSLKGSNFICKAPQITERSKNIEKTEDGKSSCSKDRVTAEESVDVSKERMKCSNPCQENEPKEDDSRVDEPSNEVTCVSKQQFQESSGKPVLKDESPAREESAVISSLRAFQNSKTHICLSCNLVSSMESFWINVVSGEVRCLNCFKRMTMKAKAKGNVLKSHFHDLDDSSVKPPRKIKSKTEKGNKTKEDSVAVGGSNSWDEAGRKRSSKCEVALQKLNGMKENVRQELLEIFGSAKRKSNKRKETTKFSCLTRRRSSSGEGIDSQKGRPSEEKVLKTEKSPRSGSSSEELVGRRLSENGTKRGVKDISGKRKRKSSSGEENFAKRERHSSSIKQGNINIPKEQYLEDDAKEETANKSEKPRGRRSSRREERSENRAKKETKGDASSHTHTSSDDTGEEFRRHKVSVIEDLNVRHCTDESRKPVLREFYPARKGHSAEEVAKISPEYEALDRSNNKNQNIWREGHDHRKLKTSKLFGWRDSNATDAFLRSTSNQKGVESQKRVDSTEQPRKSKNSDENFSPRKVHIVQDFLKRDSVRVTLPSRSSEPKASKENDNSQRGNLLNPRISTEKSGRSDASKEECVLFGEHLKKEAKPPPEGEKAKLKDLWKGLVTRQRAKPTEPAKGQVTGFVNQLLRKSKDEKRAPQKGVGSRRASDSSEGPRRKSSDEEPAVPKVLSHFNREGKRESLAAENREKKKWEEKEGSLSSGKMPKILPAGPDVLSTPTKDGSILCREKRSSKTSTGAPYGN